MRVSVIIPTLNEGETILELLGSLSRDEPHEVIVVDAGSADGTADLARSFGKVRVIDSHRGRAIQQNLGASLATGDVLLFLHADCRLAPGGLESLRRFLRENPRVPGGCFRMRVADPARVYRLIDASAHLRAGVLGMPYGDQAIFVPRWAFERVGGFPALPLMEDLYLSLRLRRLGRLAVLPQEVLVSPRRWRSQGVIRQTLLNWSLTAAAALGVPPRHLASFYAVIR